MIKYSGKTALITGASSGIGEVFAEELAKKGSNVILVARSEDKLEKLASRLSSQFKIQAQALVADLSRENAAQGLAEEIEKSQLPVDILVNNAGFATHGFFDQTSFGRQHEQVVLNVQSLMDLTHIFLQPMVDRKNGIIINVSSIAAFQPNPYMAVYGATKAFVLSFSEALWKENIDRGVKVLAVCPGPTNTGFFQVVGAEEASVGRTPMDPFQVVKASFKALEKGRSSVVPGFGNALLSQTHRFFSRRAVLGIVENMLKPA